MDYCEIDYCSGNADKVLRLDTTEESVEIGLCLKHSVQLEERLSEATGEEIDLEGSRFGTVGEINEAISYLDAIAASKHESYTATGQAVKISLPPCATCSELGLMT